MKINLKIVMTLGLLLLVMPLLFGYIATTGAQAPNLANLHENSKDVSNTLCRSCHVNVANAAAGTTGNLLNVHKRHNLSVFLNFASNFVDTATVGGPGADISSGCARCHQETVYGDNEAAVQRNFEPDDSAIQSIAFGSFGNNYEGDLSAHGGETSGSAGPNDTSTVSGDNPPVNKDVNPRWCVTCHGSLQLTGHEGTNFTTDTVSAVPLDPGACLAGDCHDGGGGNGLDPVVEHGANPWSGISWIDQRYANSETWCYRCHGELSWYQVNETN